MQVIPKDMDIEDFISKYVSLDIPIPYKDLFIYPVKVEDSFDFMSYCGIFLIDKNSIPNIEIIKMSYLKFLLSLIMDEKNGSLWAESFLKTISICLNIKYDKDLLRYGAKMGELLFDGYVDKEIICFNGYNLSFVLQNENVSLVINDCQITSREFEEIKRLMMYQNIVDYDDRQMNPAIREAIDKYYKSKNEGIRNPTIEDKISVIIANTGMKQETINNMSYRKFEQVFCKIVEKQDYLVGKIAEMQGCLKTPVEHWIYKSKKDRYSEAFTSGEFIS